MMLTVLITPIIPLKKGLHTSKVKIINPKRTIKKYKTLTIILKSFDTFVIIATTSSSITLSLTGIGLIAILIPTATACGSSISNEIINGISMQKHKKYRKQYEKDQQTFKFFDKLSKKVYNIM